MVGENGAGKSTLMKVLSRRLPARRPTTGEILFEGEERRFSGIADSEQLGIIIIHQELALVPLLSIAENIFLGNEPRTLRRHRLVRGLRARRSELLRQGRA